MTVDEIIEKIRNGEIDCNNQQSFFSKLLKGLLLKLTEDIIIRDKHVPHVILNTGDDTMWLLEKEYDYKKEPYEVTNEQYIYQTKPRCVVSPGSLDTVPDQLTNPYSRGQLQFEYDDQLMVLSGEMRRMPVKINVDLTYLLDSFTDLMTMTQIIFTKLAYIRNFKFVYLGQTIMASYRVPDNIQGDHLAEIDGTVTESKDRKISMSLEVESTLPVYDPKTIVDASKLITHTISNLDIIPKNQLNSNNKLSPHEISTRHPQTRSGYKGFGSR